MDTEKLKGELLQKFGTDILIFTEKSPRRAIATIMPQSILKVAEWLYKEKSFRFIIASALHTRKGFEIHYHFSSDPDGLILNLHVILDMNKPEIESMSNMFNASNWIEREMHELFGINFLNHPNQEKLISDGNWAEGVYPYRKEYK